METQNPQRYFPTAFFAMTTTAYKSIFRLLLIGGVLAFWQQYALSQRGLSLILSSSTENLLRPSANNKATLFDVAADIAFSTLVEEEQRRIQTRTIANFDLKTWTLRSTGGLLDDDRETLAGIYADANSVFEFGLGESTYLANYLQVPRYAGVDSDAAYVNECRQMVSSHFRFYYADVGNTGDWGYPIQNLTKAVVQYQIAPLQAEPLPFDVYMVDGRWRFALVMLSFLHAAARGADRSHTTVLLHDCWQAGHTSKQITHKKLRLVYQSADSLLDLVQHSKGLLCVYKRKPTTTDEQLMALWQQHFTNPQ